MANRNVSDLKETDEGIVIGKQRCRIALTASHEIEILSIALRDCIRRGDDGCDLLARGMTTRIEDLSHSIMSALNDESTSTEPLSFDVHRGDPIAA